MREREGEGYREELGRVGKPGLDKGGDVEDGVAAGEGRWERRVIGDISIDDLYGGPVGSDGGARRQEGEVAGGPNQSANRVSASHQGVAEPTPQVT